MKNNSIFETVTILGDQLKSNALNESNLIELKDKINLINDFFKTTTEESALLCVGIACDNRDYGIEISFIMEFLNCGKIDYFKIIMLLESLEKKGLITVIRNGYKRKSEKIKSIEISNKVYEAFYYNTNEKLFIEGVKRSLFEDIEHFLEYVKDESPDNTSLKEHCAKLFKRHEQHEILRQIQSYKLDTFEIILLFVLMMETISAGSNVKICLENTIGYYINRTLQRSVLRRRINTETSKLNELKIIEIGPQNYRDSIDVGLTNDAFNSLIPDEYKTNLKKEFKPVLSKLVMPDTINAKTLFYNHEELNHINDLSEILSSDRLKSIQDRLTQKGLRKGVQILFFGPPGTGKTETVYQLAKATNRTVLMVEINKIKSMWVGESEKNIKKIFDEYATACKEFTETPILLFNESDALINKRIKIGTSVDSMQNALQNILLQELENFEGIFIATTNLLSNLDDAFNRRFLYKLKLNKPEYETRKKIIENLLPHLPDYEIYELAKDYELSGGQIENIYRKSEMQSILKGTYPSINELKSMIEQELFSNKTSRVEIKGFNQN
jgi:hypothetical protein